MSKLPAQLPLVRADRERIGQVLTNLLSNALRHTPSGGVVSVSAAQVDGYAKISVADTGAGIAPADLPYCISYPPGHVGRVSYPPPLGRYGNLPYLPYFLDT